MDDKYRQELKKKDIIKFQMNALQQINSNDPINESCCCQLTIELFR